MLSLLESKAIGEEKAKDLLSRAKPQEAAAKAAQRSSPRQWEFTR